MAGRLCENLLHIFVILLTRDLLFRCSAVPLFRCSSVLLFFRSSDLLLFSSAVLPFVCSSVLLFYCSSVQVSRAILELRKQLHKLLPPTSRNPNRCSIIHDDVAAFSSHKFLNVIDVHQIRIVNAVEVWSIEGFIDILENF